MKRMHTLMLSSLLLAFTMSGPLMAQTKPTVKPVAMQEHKESHPHIENAIKALENAKHQLETAAHDFNGHRAKALDHVNQALEECHEALRADKK